MPNPMPAAAAAETPPPEDRLGRRLLVLRLATIGGATAALPGCIAGPPGYVGRPVLAATDADPSDGPGRGRGTYAAPVRHGPTDNDPSDGPGRGRGAYAHRGVTDNDPSDGVGHGRLTRAPARRAATDNDPSDDVGYGRSRR